MTDRREARELVVMCLHQWDLQAETDTEGLAVAFVDSRCSSSETADYARRVLRTYWERAEEIDARIEAAAENWRLARMAVVDRNVLRLAATEIMHLPDVPPKVSIDEAIELAKKYSTEKSGSFVNGILDRILSDDGVPPRTPSPPTPSSPEEN